jgi:hypothetical protein
MDPNFHVPVPSVKDPNFHVPVPSAKDPNFHVPVSRVFSQGKDPAFNAMDSSTSFSFQCPWTYLSKDSAFNVMWRRGEDDGLIVYEEDSSSSEEETENHVKKKK